MGLNPLEIPIPIFQVIRLAGLVPILAAGAILGAQPTPRPERASALEKMLSLDMTPQFKLTNVVLRTSDGDTLLSPTLGNFSAGRGFVSFSFYLDFLDSRAPVRTKDTLPSIILAFKGPIRGRCFMVRTVRDFEKNVRSLKMGMAGVASINDIQSPDQEWIIPVARRELSPGVWILTPIKPLEPGEYGVFQRGIGVPHELFDFDIAGPHSLKEYSSPEEYAKALLDAKGDNDL